MIIFLLAKYNTRRGLSVWMEDKSPIVSNLALLDVPFSVSACPFSIVRRAILYLFLKILWRQDIRIYMPYLTWKYMRPMLT